MSERRLIASPRWTLEEDDKLRRLAHEGRSAAVIAGQMNRSISSIYSRANKLGIPLARPGVRRRSVSKWG